MFLVLGRSIERVDMMARLMITTRAMNRVRSPSWPTLLRSCGAYEAYLRTYRGRVSERTAAEFLLLDRLFPRSMFVALSTAERSLRQLDTGEGRLGSTDAAIRLLGRARTGLEYRGVDEMLADLTDQLEAIQEACADATIVHGRPVLPARGACPGSVKKVPDDSCLTNHEGESAMTWRMRVRHRTGYSYDGEVRSLLQRGTDDPAHRPEPDHAGVAGRDQPERQHLPLPRLLGHRGHRVRPALPALRARGGRHQRGRDRAAALDARRAGLGRAAQRAGASTSTRSGSTSPARTDPDGTLTELAADIAGQRRQLRPRPPSACLEAIGEHLDYVPGSTDVSTNAMQAWEAGSGVCQDFAHISLGHVALDRAAGPLRLGLPASRRRGRHRPDRDSGESHAWVEWWDGEWVGYDPTNGKPAGEQHVLVARGRDYDDVTPLKGIYSGPPSSALGVLVEVTRLA